MRQQQRVPRRPPSFRKDAELILKASPGLDFTEDYTGFEFHSGVFLLGNRQGFRWLADYFDWLADRIDEKGALPQGSLSNQVNLDGDGPINHQLSDGLNFVVGSFARKHRKRVLCRCGISPRNRKPGNLVVMFRTILELLLFWAEDDRYRDSPKWPVVIEGLDQLIREAEQTVAMLQTTLKKTATKAGSKARKTGSRFRTKRSRKRSGKDLL